MSADKRQTRRNENQRRRRLSEAHDDGPRLAADDVARRRKVAEASQRDTKRGLVRPFFLLAGVHSPLDEDGKQLNDDPRRRCWTRGGRAPLQAETETETEGPTTRCVLLEPGCCRGPTSRGVS